MNNAKKKASNELKEIHKVEKEEEKKENEEDNSSDDSGDDSSYDDSNLAQNEVPNEVCLSDYESEDEKYEVGEYDKTDPFFIFDQSPASKDCLYA
jgi:hypothetical protein